MKQIKTKIFIKLPLFWKFAIMSTIIVIIFGAINIYMLWNSVYKSFEKEIDKRCKVLARIVAEKSLNPLVYEDYLSIYKILEEIQSSDPSISYILVLNAQNKVVAQTYNLTIPKGLIHVNSLNSNKYHIQVIKAKHFKHPVIRDIAYPIWIFSYLITSPIKKISEKARRINLNSIDNEKCEINKKIFFNLFNIKIYDELDLLIEKISEMLLRLRKNYFQLKETQNALVQAEKMASLGTLSAGVAHEINNPISGIKNCINRINKKPENTQQNLKYIELIKEATEKIENVVQHLLSYSRKQEFVTKKVILNQVIDSAIQLTKHRLGGKNVKIISNFDQNFSITGSFNHLEQILVNFILNS